ncbi:MAG TPA: glycosyltransferase [Nitrococcus sp.]|nr:glycosyltransferase [Nitrococcus sp.]
MAEQQEYPLVTFALFTYNQGKYVREAVEGALAQNYPNLEIIISDDASTDGTWDVIRDAVSHYSGRHTVRTFRNQTNLGVVQHTLVRGREAHGDLVIMAAGDDISEPYRTTCLAAAFEADPLALAGDSLVNIVDESGVVIKRNAERPRDLAPAPLYLKNGFGAAVQGSSSAYRKCIFDVPIELTRYEFPEDILFAFYNAVLRGRKISVNRPLVRYRMHPGALVNHPKFSASVSASDAAEVKSVAAARAWLQLIEVLVEVAKANHAESQIDMRAMCAARAHAEMVCAWRHLSVRQRCTRIVKRLGEASASDLRWMVLRALGTFPAYQPRKWMRRWA